MPEPTAVSQPEATPPSDEEAEEDAPAEVSFSVSPRLVQVKRLLFLFADSQPDSVDQPRTTSSGDHAPYR